MPADVRGIGGLAPPGAVVANVAPPGLVRVAGFAPMTIPFDAPDDVVAMDFTYTGGEPILADFTLVSCTPVDPLGAPLATASCVLVSVETW
jgi:hypothetical protein